MTMAHTQSLAGEGKKRLTAQQVEDLATEILCGDEADANAIRDALEDVVGYDTTKAEALMRAEAEARALAEQAERQARMSPQAIRARAQQQRLAWVRAELYRDHRHPVIKAFCYARAVVPVYLAGLRQRLHDRGIDIPIWAMLALPTAFLIMMLSRLLVSAPVIEEAASSYTTRCGMCSDVFDVSREHFEQLSFLKAHPDNFKVAYPNADPPQPVSCRKCNATHASVTLMTCPQTEQRYLLATPADMPIPEDEASIRDLSPFAR